MKKIQRTKITFEVLTRASEPLEIPENVLEVLLDGLERAVMEHVDLRYHPDGNRYLDERHEFIGVDLVEVAA